MATETLGGTLPPGRHGLPRDFIVANWRHRILNGMARAIGSKGFLACTVKDIVAEARVSRRTFYECFPAGKDEAAEALVEYGSGFEAADLETGLGILTVELVAMTLVGNAEAAIAAADSAASLLSGDLRLAIERTPTEGRN